MSDLEAWRKPLTPEDRAIFTQQGRHATKSALLAIIDAYEFTVATLAARLAEWDQHQCPQYTQHHQSRLDQLRQVMAERDALRAERERDAPVLEAAVAYVEADPKRYKVAVRLAGAVAAWRAAREG